MGKVMNLFVNFFIFLLVLGIFENKVFSLNNYEIREICQKKRRKLRCIKDLKYKRFDLLRGNRIEIEVIPFKK